MEKEKYSHFNIASQNKLLLNKKVNLCQSCSLIFPDELHTISLTELLALPVVTFLNCPYLPAGLCTMDRANSTQDGQVKSHTNSLHQGEVYKQSRTE